MLIFHFKKAIKRTYLIYADFARVDFVKHVFLKDLCNKTLVEKGRNKPLLRGNYLPTNSAQNFASYSLRS
jgi:hypothetical protein